MVSDKQILDLARLSAIEISPAELPYYREQLAKIVGFMGQLQSFEPAAAQPQERPTPIAQGERADQCCRSLNIDDVVLNAQAVSGSSFKVPKFV